MLATTTPQIAGELRDRQNWIGGNAYNPGRADFVPPPPENVAGLMDDLVAFVNRSDLSPVVQAAIAHAQFETIHPFADGNGRVGRALVHVLLRRRGLAPRYVPPVSLVLAADAKSYVAGLTAFQDERVADWVLLFAQAIERAASEASALAARLAELQEQWRTRAGRPRRHSSAETLIVELPAHPIVTVATAQRILGRSKQAATRRSPSSPGRASSSRSRLRSATVPGKRASSSTSSTMSSANSRHPLRTSLPGRLEGSPGQGRELPSHAAPIAGRRT